MDSITQDNGTQEKWEKTIETARKVYWHSRGVLHNGESASWDHAWRVAIKQGYSMLTANQIANDAQRNYEDKETAWNQCMDFVARGYTDFAALMEMHGDQLTPEQQQQITEMIQLTEEYF